MERVPVEAGWFVTLKRNTAFHSGFWEIVGYKSERFYRLRQKGSKQLIVLKERCNAKVRRPSL
jgi:hypothetical protein